MSQPGFVHRQWLTRLFSDAVGDRYTTNSRAICQRRVQALKTRYQTSPTIQISMETEPSSSSPSSASVDVESLKRDLISSLDGLNFGLDIDADAEIMGDEENDVEDLIEEIENLNFINKDHIELIDGDWKLLYTSSTLSRYSGGLTGVHRYLPEGKVLKIRQKIDLQDMSCTFIETVQYELPFVDKEFQVDVIVTGKLRIAVEENRLIWNAEDVKVGRLFSWFADGWKSLRALKIQDISYLDHNMQIVRGQTGSVNVFMRE